MHGRGSYPNEASTLTMPPAQAPATMGTHLEVTDQEVIDVDEIEEIVGGLDGEDKSQDSQPGKRIAVHIDKPKKQLTRRWPCEGLPVKFPEGTNHHVSYPFGLHNERSIPWNYRSTDDAFYLQAKTCQKTSPMEGGVCENCQRLTSSTLFSGIMERIKYGTHENTPLVYQGAGGLVTIIRRKTDQIVQLRMSKLNDSRKLLTKASALEDHKQWILAIASGRVDRVASLVQAGLTHRVGIRTLIQQYELAAEKLYKPKAFTNEDIMRSIVLLRLGGARVAQFAHQSLALPSLTTIRRQTVLPALLVSPSAPTVAEVEANIIASCSSLHSIARSRSGGSALGTEPRQPSDKIVHQVLMLDELAVEKRARWDDSHNKFQGTCREHNYRIPLDFTSERELDILCDAIQNEEVHLATEVRLFFSMITPKLITSLFVKGDSGRYRCPFIRASGIRCATNIILRYLQEGDK